MAELIARQSGWHLDTAPVALGWKNSPTHRSLLETSSYRLIGVGWARGRLNGSLTTIWTVRLGAAVSVRSRPSRLLPLSRRRAAAPARRA